MTTKSSAAAVKDLQSRIAELEEQLTMTTLTGFPFLLNYWEAKGDRGAMATLLLNNRYSAAPGAPQLGLPADSISVYGEAATQVKELLDEVNAIPGNWVVLSFTGRWRGFGDIETNAAGYQNYPRKALACQSFAVVRSAADKFAEPEIADEA